MTKNTERIADTLRIRLRRLRTVSGCTQSQVDKLINLPPMTTCNAERGIQIRYEKLCAYADFYGVSVDYLLGREPESLKVLNYFGNKLKEDEMNA